MSQNSMRLIVFIRDTQDSAWKDYRPDERIMDSGQLSEVYSIFARARKTYVDNWPVKHLLTLCQWSQHVGKYSLIAGSPLTLITTLLMARKRWLFLVPAAAGGAVWGTAFYHEDIKIPRLVQDRLESGDGKHHFQPEERQVIRDLAKICVPKGLSEGQQVRVTKFDKIVFLGTGIGLPVWAF